MIYADYNKTLLAMGYSVWVAGNSIRLSLGCGNTQKEIHKIIAVIADLSNASAKMHERRS